MELLVAAHSCRGESLGDTLVHHRYMGACRKTQKVAEKNLQEQCITFVWSGKSVWVYELFKFCDIYEKKMELSMVACRNLVISYYIV